MRIMSIKLMRDIRRSLSAYLICMLVVSAGFMGYSMMLVTYDNMDAVQTDFFAETDYCDGVAKIVSAPETVKDRLGDIPGVAQVTGRVVEEVSISNIGEDDTKLKLLSFTENGLNSVQVTQGKMPGRQAEILIGKGFYEENHLAIGDSLQLHVNGVDRQVFICGYGITPENIYLRANSTEMMPNRAKYDVGFLDKTVMQQMFQMDGNVNEFLFRMKPGYEFEDIQDEIEVILQPYGVLTTYKGSDDASASVLKSEMEELEVFGLALPALFLGVAAIILYIMLNRMIDQQRTQIGTLMAMGIKMTHIRWHYAAYGILVGLFGGLSGGVLGSFAANPLTVYYQDYFQFPNVGNPVDIKYVIQGVIIGSIFCGAIAFFCTGKMKKLLPSEALRPEAPRTGKKMFLEKFPGFLKMFTTPGIMGMRSISRYKVRSLLSVVGTACAFMLTAVILSMDTLFDVYIFDEITKNQHQDLAVNLTGYVSETDAMEYLSMPEMQRMEGVLQIGCKIYSPQKEFEAMIMGTDQDAQLTRLYAEDGRKIYVKPEGIVLSEFMAKSMNVGIGDYVTVEISQPEKQYLSLQITDIMAQYMGTTFYMSKEQLGKLTPYRELVSQIKIQGPTYIKSELKSRMADSPYKGTVETRQEYVDLTRSMVGSIDMMMGMLVLVGVLIGIAVIYTSSLIYYEELKREISTLLMLGLRAKESLDVISIGQYILTTGSILLGIPMAAAASKIISEKMKTDMYVMPDFISGKALAEAAVLMYVAVFISSKIVLHKVNKIAPVELLRERE